MPTDTNGRFRLRAGRHRIVDLIPELREISYTPRRCGSALRRTDSSANSRTPRSPVRCRSRRRSPRRSVAQQGRSEWDSAIERLAQPRVLQVALAFGIVAQDRVRILRLRVGDQGRRPCRYASLRLARRAAGRSRRGGAPRARTIPGPSWAPDHRYGCRALSPAIRSARHVRHRPPTPTRRFPRRRRARASAPAARQSIPTPRPATAPPASTPASRLRSRDQHDACRGSPSSPRRRLPWCRARRRHAWPRRTVARSLAPRARHRRHTPTRTRASPARSAPGPRPRRVRRNDRGVPIEMDPPPLRVLAEEPRAEPHSCRRGGDEPATSAGSAPTTGRARLGRARNDFAELHLVGAALRDDHLVASVVLSFEYGPVGEIDQAPGLLAELGECAATPIDTDVVILRRSGATMTRSPTALRMPSASSAASAALACGR